VGGTHTDAVIVDHDTIRAQAKVPTDHDNLLRSVRAALDAVLTGMKPSAVTRLNLSTTLSTNAIVENKTEEVGVFVSAGPGIDPENMRTGKHYYVIPGSIDHRGKEIEPLDPALLHKAVKECRADGVKVFASVGKFSVRNPAHENAMSEALADQADFMTHGHALSGILNFPRRVATSYFNSAVWRTYNDFAWAVEETIKDFGLTCEINILKADGGTMPFSVSKTLPVESILSGPAASVMGMIALESIADDCVILDIGGTTTDIAVFADGAPVIEKEGMTVGSYPTLVKALTIRSIGVGGDSALYVERDGVRVGPERKGPPLALCDVHGGTSCEIGSLPGETPSDRLGRVCAPALTDVLNYLGLSEFGDVEASRAGIKSLCGQTGQDAKALCDHAVEYAANKIRDAVEHLLWAINEKPVYTITELLEGKTIKPKRVYVMGGPAMALAGHLEKTLGLPVVVPGHYAVANAIGAALTRTTMDIELFADTQKRRMIVPAMDHVAEIPKSYNLEDATNDAVRLLQERLKELGVTDGFKPEITGQGSFNMVEGFRTVGRNIRVKCQVRPGVIRTLAD
jgi:N-methylhydantoinase A/oxoprolinase/acetone carboxylase beta subunit